MAAFLIPTAVGIVLMVFGISYIKGNITSIHSYHIQRLRKEDKLVYGKLMGIGTILCSVVLIVFGSLLLLADMLDKAVLITIGSYVTIVGLAVGIIIMTYATIKYNKGLF